MADTAQPMDTSAAAPAETPAEPGPADATAGGPPEPAAPDAAAAPAPLDVKPESAEGGGKAAAAGTKRPAEDKAGGGDAKGDDKVKVSSSQQHSVGMMQCVTPACESLGAVSTNTIVQKPGQDVLGISEGTRL